MATFLCLGTPTIIEGGYHEGFRTVVCMPVTSWDALAIDIMKALTPFGRDVGAGTPSYAQANYVDVPIWRMRQ